MTNAVATFTPNQTAYFEAQALVEATCKALWARRDERTKIANRGGSRKGRKAELDAIDVLIANLETNFKSACDKRDEALDKLLGR